MAAETITAGTVATIGGAATGIVFFGELSIEKTLILSLGLTAIGAFVGCMHSVKAADTNGSNTAMFAFFIKWILTACITAGVLSYAAEAYLNLPAKQWPALVGLFIAALANHWQNWVKSIIDAVVNKFVRKTNES